MTVGVLRGIKNEIGRILSGYFLRQENIALLPFAYRDISGSHVISQLVVGLFAYPSTGKDSQSALSCIVACLVLCVWLYSLFGQYCTDLLLVYKMSSYYSIEAFVVCQLYVVGIFLTQYL